jgi:AcrR family transcriptional regulator
LEEKPTIHENAPPHKHFHAIPPEKQHRILQAALEEFASKDYANASTNAIVVRAQISKGLLFHYFGDKSGLYTYLLDHVAKKLYRDTMATVDIENSDIFDILQKSIEAKFEVAKHSLLETRLYLRAMTGDIPPKAREFLDQSVSQAYDTLALMTSHLSEDYLKEGLDREKVIKIILWACEGITNHLLSTLTPENEDADYVHMMDYTEDYFKFMRSLFYKPEAKQDMTDWPETGEKAKNFEKQATKATKTESATGTTFRKSGEIPETKADTADEPEIDKKAAKQAMKAESEARTDAEPYFRKSGKTGDGSSAGKKASRKGG